MRVGISRTASPEQREWGSGLYGYNTVIQHFLQLLRVCGFALRILKLRKLGPPSCMEGVGVREIGEERGTMIILPVYYNLKR